MELHEVHSTQYMKYMSYKRLKSEISTGGNLQKFLLLMVIFQKFFHRS